MFSDRMICGSRSHLFNSKIYFSSFILFLILALSFLAKVPSAVAQLDPAEVEALGDIAKELGITTWDFNEVLRCEESDPAIAAAPMDEEQKNSITCNCTVEPWHVVNISLKRQDLQGVLPKELVRLPHLQSIDLSRNYLNGSIPPQWGTLPLVYINVQGNRLSGTIPKALGNISTLTILILEANQFSGHLPQELGNLTNLEKVQFSSNEFTGELPTTFAKLAKMHDFRINDNRMNGMIPDFIQSWTNLTRLEMIGSGLKGPIPPGISQLGELTNLRIGDINGTGVAFPQLNKMMRLKTLTLRNCNISDVIPSYIWQLPSLRKLYLTRNLLSGSIPDWMLKLGPSTSIDMSYNNFTPGNNEASECQQNGVNLFKSSFVGNNKSGDFQCSSKKFHCEHRNYWLYINCGGKEVKVGKNTYDEDLDNSGSSYFHRSKFWAYSSTGYYPDASNSEDGYIVPSKETVNASNPELYKMARVSPISLTYYGFCMGNGSYNVTLHFAEIAFSNNKSYTSLGKRIFDVYIQEKRVLKDFNIEDEAHGAFKPIERTFPANVTDSLEIRFYWAGKGTQSIPTRGVYGPLISAISVVPDFIPPTERGKKISTTAVVGIIASVLFFIFLVLGILWRKGCLGSKTARDEGLRGLDLQTGSFTLRQIKAATNNFDPSNKIGEGGFGSVYKGLLLDGTTIAVKQLSSKSRQGNREFLNEIGMISALRHPNLVKIYGCCIEAKQLLLVYEYMENNSLAHALFGPKECQLQLDWPTRNRICIGIARGLAYLHEESTLKVVHRDIKATNVLLDRDLNPKISDFGLARLHEEEDTHISTRVAGTLGYMAPEYAMHGYLTDTVDVYSFGVVTLEIVSGKSITSYRPKGDHVHLVDWAYVLQQQGNQLELVDPRLGLEFNKEEAITMIDVALLCTSASPTLRPKMSAVVKMLGGVVEDPISDLNLFSDDFNAKAVGNFPQEIRSVSSSPTHSLIASTDQPWTESVSIPDLYPINPDSHSWSNIN
ncbi:probable LRR receptor-like serine/threonine-protein kinase At1g53420 isoform X2 [Magnolia sinica]|uniref:probable LRR receptor-like serine/threonine-protein kinase At1g53420 isoform X2 n=1 Tax=Magnolia sinica TaxID=86752 RepID=UPI00265B62F0|nr:probable LRR receptor-like serine/threonine-protein kinase At1g53420 isoform X2 [Magnolia sinica]